MRVVAAASQSEGGGRYGLGAHVNKETKRMANESDTKPKKKSLWALLKESMDKASSGCGPGCSCHVEKPRQGTQPAANSEGKAEKS